MQYAQTLHSPNSDPFPWERVTAFKETFLRHGTVVVCALLCPFQEADTSPPARSGDAGAAVDAHHGHGGESAASYYRSQVDGVLAELLEYERGHWASSRPGEEQEGDARPVSDGLHMTMLRAFQVPEEVEEEVDQPAEDGEEDEDVDGSWLFKIDVLDYDAGDADGNSVPRVVVKPDAREAMVLKWVQEG
jgi:hypothetical protein